MKQQQKTKTKTMAVRALCIFLAVLMVGSSLMALLNVF